MVRFTDPEMVPPLEDVELALLCGPMRGPEWPAELMAELRAGWQAHRDRIMEDHDRPDLAAVGLVAVRGQRADAGSRRRGRTSRRAKRGRLRRDLRRSDGLGRVVLRAVEAALDRLSPDWREHSPRASSGSVGRSRHAHGLGVPAGQEARCCHLRRRLPPRPRRLRRPKTFDSLRSRRARPRPRSAGRSSPPATEPHRRTAGGARGPGRG